MMLLMNNVQFMFHLFDMLLAEYLCWSSWSYHAKCGVWIKLLCCGDFFWENGNNHGSCCFDELEYM